MTQLVQSISNAVLAPPVVHDLVTDSDKLPLSDAGPFKVHVRISPSASAGYPLPQFSTDQITYFPLIEWKPGATGASNGLTNIMFVYELHDEFKVNYMVSYAGNLLTMINSANATASCCMSAPNTQKFHFTVHFTDALGNLFQHDPYIQVTPP